MEEEGLRWGDANLVLIFFLFPFSFFLSSTLADEEFVGAFVRWFVSLSKKEKKKKKETREERAETAGEERKGEGEEGD